MPLISPLMPIPQHFSISVTQNFWLCLLAWPILGLTQSATPPAVALAKKFLVTELLKCDLFVAANLVRDKTHSSQMFFFLRPQHNYWEATLALNYSLDQFWQWVFRHKIFYNLFVALCKLCSPMQLRAFSMVLRHCVFIWKYNGLK